MKQGKRALAGAIALTGLLATAGPAVAKDRVIAVDGVSKADASRRVEILVHVPDGQSASDAAERALAGQGAKKAPKPPPEQPQSNSYSFTGLFWDTRRVTQNYNPAGSRNTAGVPEQPGERVRVRLRRRGRLRRLLRALARERALGGGVGVLPVGHVDEDLDAAVRIGLRYAVDRDHAVLCHRGPRRGEQPRQRDGPCQRALPLLHLNLPS